MHTQMYYHGLDMFPYQPISRIWMIMYILSSFCFFTKLNRLIRTNNNCKKIIQTNWLRENTLLSFIHASITSILVIIGILRAPEMLEDPLSHSNHFNYALIAFSTGYFIYDLLDIIQNSTASSIKGIVAHHLMVLTYVTHVLYYTRNVGYAICGLSIEVNSIFLHARRLIRWYSPITTSNYYNNLLKIIVNIGNYLTFILLRFGVLMVALRALYIQRNRIDPFMQIFITVVGLAMCVLNIVLFYRLNISQFRIKSKVTSDEDKTLITENHILSSS
jgi:hypothetical protein